MKKTILFDLDDTLIESMQVLGVAFVHLFEKLNITMDLGVAQEKFLKMTQSEIFSYIKENFDVKQDEEWMLHEIRKDVLDQYQNTIPLKDGAKEFIEACSKKGMKMAVITSNYREVAQMVLHRFDLLSHITNIYSAEELHMSKREKDIYLYVLKDLDTTCEEALLFEDSIYAINVAKKLNIDCIGLVNDTNQKVFEENHIRTIKSYKELL